MKKIATLIILVSFLVVYAQKQPDSKQTKTFHPTFEVRSIQIIH